MFLFLYLDGSYKGVVNKCLCLIVQSQSVLSVLIFFI